MISVPRVRALLRKELRQLFRDPKTKRMVFGAPIIQLLLFGYAVNTDVTRVATFVVDHDRTEASRALLDAFTAPGYFQVVGRSARPADLDAALDRGSVAVGLWIPRGFAADLAGGRGATVQVLVDGTNSNTATVAQGYATRIVRSFGLARAGAGGTGAGGANAAPLPTGVELRTRAWYNPDLASRVYNVPAVVALILILMCFLLTAMTVVRERELGTLEQLMVSPLSAGELMLGKTLPVALIGLADLVLVVAVAILWFDIPFRGNPLLLLAASAVFILASLGLGLFISTVSNTQQEAFMGMFMVILPLIILSGFMYPIHTMPDFFQGLTLLNPLRYFLEIVRGVFLKGAGLAVLWPQLLVLTAMAAGILTLATLRFRRTLR
ncbi:MAG: ABC transporter permease [Gemmatimonadota bacterium]